MMNNIIKHRKELHKIPEIGHQEFKTTSYLLEVMTKFESFEIDQPLKTGLVAFKKGTSSSKCVAFRADIDALPMEEKTGVDYKSTHKGFMHACGHDIHMATLLGLAEELEKNPCEEDVLLIFQPAEEGPGGAMPMIEAGILDKYKPDEIYALHVSPEYPVGTIATKPGTLFVSNSELFIDLYGKSAHGAIPHEGNDMIVAGMNLVNQLHTVISRNINPSNCAVVTVGKFNAGTRLNIITDHARIEGTIRVKDTNDMPIIKRRITSMVEGVAKSFEAKYDLDFGVSYSAVVNDDEKLAFFYDRVGKLEGIKIVECEHTMASEDFGFFLERVPGVMFWLGASQGKELGLHHPEFLPEESSIEVGIKAFRALLN
jgi:N-acetyldiaminopimelate deacetylase